VGYLMDEANRVLRNRIAEIAPNQLGDVEDIVDAINDLIDQKIREAKPSTTNNSD